MEVNKRILQKKRRYTEAFKRSIVADYESGKYSVYQIEKLHGIPHASIYNWIYKFSTFNEKGYRVIEMKKSSTSKVNDLEKRVKELERIVGQKQIKIDFLEKMIDVAKDELDIDIKKKFDTPPSAGLGKTNKK